MLTNIIDILVPDIGGAAEVDVIEILVKPGDVIAKEASLITLEGDKATMEIPSPIAGVVQTITVKVGDKVSEGMMIMKLSVEAESTEKRLPEKSPVEKLSIEQVLVPDIGGASNLDIIEVNVASGDVIKKEETLITLEGDKATMEIPSPFDGVVKIVSVNVGDKVSEGTLILTIEVQATDTKKTSEQILPPSSIPAPRKSPATRPQTMETISSGPVHATPAVRRIAREFGVDLARVLATGRKNRILKTDVQAYVKGQLSKTQNGSGAELPTAPDIDFSQFGNIEKQALTKINRLTGKNLSRNWLLVPHVTQFNEADITELEVFRKTNKEEAEKQGYKLTPLVFLLKAVVACLKEFPRFNASLDATGEQLILKKYYHIGVAVDTPNGLVVPVIRDVDKKGMHELAKELAEISQKARDVGLSLKEMQGGCFTISSLGGIGGTAFTPIVNVPEVAILGVSRSEMKLVYDGQGEFKPRLMLPLSLSYDHRVIDGADGARFIMHLSTLLADSRWLVL